MEQYKQEINNYESFQLRKIPFNYKSKNKNEILNDENIDKIKILDLSNMIDKWEQELLFSQNGFFSLQGKEVENKTDEFVQELENFINSKIDEIHFSDIFSKELAQKIKKEKISSIQKEMMIYEQQQLLTWQLNVYEQAIISTIERAVFYKSNPNIVSSSLKNGLSVIKMMAEKEDWKQNIYKFKIKKYKSEFYYALISAFLQDKDINAYKYFKKYENLLEDKSKKELEKTINEFKINVTAYTWAKEVFSYHLTDKELESEIKHIKDFEIKELAKQFLNDFKISEKRKKETENKNKNSQNWQDIVNLAKTDIDKAFLYIDYSLGTKNVKFKKDYLTQLKKQGYIKTNFDEFLKLLSEVFENFEQFKIKDISDFQHCLSDEDYKLFVDLQNKNQIDFNILYSDYQYSLVIMKNINLQTSEEKYNFLNQFYSDKAKYKSINQKEPDIIVRNKIIDALKERFEKKKERIK
jgi:hypothetical protein